MNESHRVAYLKAMGIDQYYPRRELPHAKPSPSYHFDEPALTETVAETAPARPTPVRKSVPEQPVLQAVPDESDSAPVQKAGPRLQSAAVAERTDSITFQLEFYRVHDELAIVADRPGQSSADQLQQARELLLAIVRAVLPDQPDKLPPALGFSWPLSADIAADSSPQQAAMALQGFIRSRQEQDGFSNLLVFTEILAGLLGGAEGNAPDQPVQFTGRDLRLTVCHGLHSMLSVPALKRDTWQALQDLRKRLQGTA